MQTYMQKGASKSTWKWYRLCLLLNFSFCNTDSIIIICWRRHVLAMKQSPRLCYKHNHNPGEEEKYQKSIRTLFYFGLERNIKLNGLRYRFVFWLDIICFYSFASKNPVNIMIMSEIWVRGDAWNTNRGGKDPMGQILSHPI